MLGSLRLRRPRDLARRSAETIGEVAVARGGERSSVGERLTFLNRTLLGYPDPPMDVLLVAANRR
jgi:hypothetical protein